MAKKMRPADSEEEIQAAKDRNRDMNGQVVVVREHLKGIPVDKLTSEGYVEATGYMIVLSTGEYFMEYNTDHYHDAEDCLCFNEGELPDSPMLEQFAAREEEQMFLDGEYKKDPEERITLLQNIPEYSYLSREENIMAAIRKVVQYKIIDSVKLGSGLSLKYYRLYCHNSESENPSLQNTVARPPHPLSECDFQELKGLDPRVLLSMTKEEFLALKKKFEIIPATEYFQNKYGKTYYTNENGQDFFDIKNEKLLDKLITDIKFLRRHPIECRNLRDKELSKYEPLVIVEKTDSGQEILPIPFFWDTERSDTDPDKYVHTSVTDPIFRRAAWQCGGDIGEYGKDLYRCLRRDILKEDAYLNEQLSIENKNTDREYVLTSKKMDDINKLSESGKYFIRDFMENVIITVTRASELDPLYINKSMAEVVGKLTLDFSFQGKKIATVKGVPIADLEEVLDMIHKGDDSKLIYDRDFLKENKKIDEMSKRSLGDVVNELIDAKIQEEIKNTSAATRKRKAAAAQRNSGKLKD